MPIGNVFLWKFKDVQLYICPVLGQEAADHLLVVLSGVLLVFMGFLHPQDLFQLVRGLHLHPYRLHVLHEEIKALEEAEGALAGGHDQGLLPVEDDVLFLGIDHVPETVVLVEAHQVLPLVEGNIRWLLQFMGFEFVLFYLDLGGFTLSFLH